MRKRVIRILRAACIEPRDSPHRADACVRLLSRVNDEEASIQDLVVKTFSSLLFSPLETAPPAPSSAALSLEERCALLLDLLRRPDVQQPLVSVIKRCLTPVSSRCHLPAATTPKRQTPSPWSGWLPPLAWRDPFCRLTKEALSWCATSPHGPVKHAHVCSVLVFWEDEGSGEGRGTLE